MLQMITSQIKFLFYSFNPLQAPINSANWKFGFTIFLAFSGSWKVYCCSNRLRILCSSVGFVKFAECGPHARTFNRNVKYENINYLMSRILGKLSSSNLNYMLDVKHCEKQRKKWTPYMMTYWYRMQTPRHLTHIIQTCRSALIRRS